MNVLIAILLIVLDLFLKVFFLPSLFSCDVMSVLNVVWKPRPSAVGVWNLSYWTTREVPKEEILKGEKVMGK